MKFIRKKSKNFLARNTEISNIFIHDIVPITNPKYISIFLYAYMFSEVDTLVIDNNDIARNLNMKIEDVLGAWTFFEEQGIIKKHGEDIEFLDISENVFSDNDAEVQTFEEDENAKQIEEMFSKITMLKGKEISRDEAKKLQEVLYDMNVPPAFIVLAYEYLNKSKSSLSFNNVKKTLFTWEEQGYKTEEDIRNYIEKYSERQNDYLKIAGFLGMYPPLTNAEKNEFEKWLSDYNFSLEEIEAFSSLASGTNKKFKYVKKVVEGEYEKKTGTKIGSGASKKSSSAKLDKREYYRRIREENEALLEERRAEVYKNIPEIKKIDDEIKSFSLEITKLIMSNFENKMEKIGEKKKEIDTLTKRKDFLLADKKYPSSYLKPIYTCTICKDTGIKDDGTSCECSLNIGK